MKTHYISPEPLTWEIIDEIVDTETKLILSDESVALIQKCRDYLDAKIESEDKPIYGINTGFGSLCNKSIPKNDLSQLQKNLVMSHACGMGEKVEPQVVKLMLLFKIHALSLGYSGVQVQTVQRLVDFYNEDIYPIVYELGSLGASGDLAPLAHLCLPMLGEGEVIYNNERIWATEMLEKFNWEPITLQAKEGLALLNGTQFMSAHGALATLKAFKLSKISDISGAISLEAYDGRIEPFCGEIHRVRPHPGQIETAKNIRRLLEGSELINQPKAHVQDPYSFRCIPQVHGAAKDTINYVASVVLREINSVTDNPTIFPDEDMIVSGGNFHGEPLAFAFDFLAIALAELGNISERRVYRLISGQRGLPEFLVANPGLNSGFMIPQYSAASIVSQNKQLCTPSSVDSITSSNEQEDHVSMGANGATKVMRVAFNVDRIIAIELFVGAQALEFRKPKKTSPYLQEFVKEFRQAVPFVEEDKIMYKEMKAAVKFIRDGRFGEN
ncbi:MAG: histidine ammonia-lyase [Bacteroidales bacterium]|nr:histidine ammonia-lyase [Bacteroidales bacterium]MCF8457618.1 histidine ammonia-lyase [Bacteroidales bacterium]